MAREAVVIKISAKRGFHIKKINAKQITSFCVVFLAHLYDTFI